MWVKSSYSVQFALWTNNPGCLPINRVYQDASQGDCPILEHWGLVFSFVVFRKRCLLMSYNQLLNILLGKKR